ncbi:MAG TPA: diaminopimelate decarboxylase, partial [Jiangellaceae bacterium]
MPSHEAGALHADAGSRGPLWLREPTDVNALVPRLWPRTVQRAPDGVLQVAGVGVDVIADRFGTPAYVVDESDFRSRAREFRLALHSAFTALGADADVFYAGKAFMNVAIVRWIAAEGLGLDVCTGGELAVALRAGFPPGRIGMHGNNKSEAELARALSAGVGRIIVDSAVEIDRLARLVNDRGGRAKVMLRSTVGVEAHTHEYIATAHEDQKFGFSLTGGSAADAVAAILAEPTLELIGLHSHIGSQIFDTAAFEVAARRTLVLHAQVRDKHGLELPELDLGGGFGMAYTTQDDPEPADELAAELAAIVGTECQTLGVAV